MKDDAFIRETRVPMTKEAVRLMVLERLELTGAQHFIDVGAGSGSIAIEAALRHPQLNVTAIERNAAAISVIEQNCQRFECQHISLLQGEAPLPLNVMADAIFIGGSGGQLTALIDWSLAHLTPTGRLVMTFILQDNLTEAIAYLKQSPVQSLDCCELQVSAMTPLGQSYYFKPNNPTYLISCQKENVCV